MKMQTQVTGNVGMYYACYKLSCMGWNVMPTARNASRNVYVMKSDEVRGHAHRGEKDGKVSFWLQPKSYEKAEFKEAWHRIGFGHGDQ